MKVVCYGREEYPIANLDPDQEDVAHSLADEYNKERGQAVGCGPSVYWSSIPHVIDVTTDEFEEYERVRARMDEMSSMFLSRVAENEKALEASGIYQEKKTA
jgi:hypothetical protein